jgi:hypothetical protein
MHKIAHKNVTTRTADVVDIEAVTPTNMEMTANTIIATAIAMRRLLLIHLGVGIQLKTAHQ